MRLVRIGRILCPLDFSQASESAFRHATALAAWYGATITALHVTTRTRAPAGRLAPAYTVTFSGSTVANTGQTDSRHWRVLRELGQTTRRAREAGIPVRILVVHGEPASEILRRAREIGADLLVVGADERPALERGIPASATTRLSRRAPCPVWSVATASEPRASQMELRTILCAVDFSEPSLRALDYSFSLARERRSRVLLLHVLGGRGGAGPQGRSLRQHDAAPTMRHSRARLRALVPAGADQWCRPEVRIASGRPQREIPRVARVEGADLIVMGARHRRVFEADSCGWPLHAVAREAGCPVLAVPAPARGGEAARR
jgi:nucleotide-binding universal stress UspA family protein